MALHPDKSAAKSNGLATENDGVDIALIKTAFETLFDPELRMAYDTLLSSNHQDWLNARATSVTRSRPAEVISLDELTEWADNDELYWTHPCRCGAEFKLTELDLDTGKHLVACESCSEVVFVGYEALEGDEDIGNKSGNGN